MFAKNWMYYSSNSDKMNRADMADAGLKILDEFENNSIFEALTDVNTYGGYYYILRSAHLGCNFSEYPRNVSSLIIEPGHPQQAQDAPLQSGQLRREHHGRLLARHQLVTLHILEQVDHLPSRRSTARAALGVQR